MNILSLLAEKAEIHPNKIAFAFLQNKTNEYDQISFVQFGEAFPVDSGHQAKIRREVLSDWLRNK